MNLTDAHYHDSAAESWCRMGGRLFAGAHPWHLGEFDEGRLVKMLEEDPELGVGEIGLDRVREKEISEEARRIFARQLTIAAYFRRPVVLHGAKCWGEVVEMVRPFKGQIPAMLFHGFSRSEGLIKDIVDLNGYISVGPTILNDHAENYRALIGKVPRDRILAETDNDREKHNDIAAIYAKLNELYGLTEEELEENCGRFRAERY